MMYYKYKFGDDKDQILNEIKKKNLHGLSIASFLKSDKVEDLSFLNSFDELEGLFITYVNEPDFTFLKSLKNLKLLIVLRDGKNLIDLSFQFNLENLNLVWRKKITGLGSCKKLKNLTIWHHKGEDLGEILELSNLKVFDLKTSNIKSLGDMSKMQNLETFDIGGCRNLENIEGLRNLQNLKILRFDSCPKMYNLDVLGTLNNLVELELYNCKTIKSIKFIEELPHISNVRLTGNTFVEDNDIKPLLKVKQVYAVHHKSYNIKL